MLGLIVFGGLAFSLAPAAQAFDINNPVGGSGGGAVCTGANGTSSAAYCKDVKQNGGGSNQITGSKGILLKAANIIAVLGGIVAVIMIIVGAIVFTTSGGDAKGVGTAKSMILYALIGIIAIALAQVIIRFVIGRFLS
ncbi:MAG: hypothetical protein ACREGA_04090 [Candidatus Saccharimonadales bacterium]